MAGPPQIAVVVPSHDRPLRLRELLNALAEQTLTPDAFEVIVGHDSSGRETAELLAGHRLALEGRLRSVASEPGTAAPGRNRNRAWRLARAPLIAFTDDDCRPPPEWLERCLAAALASPGAIVQGATRPDPREQEVLDRAAWAHTQSIWPPRPWAQACNIVYPRAVLEACAGFPEDMLVGEDTALAETARARGVDYVGAPEAVTYHAVNAPGLLGMVRGAARWQGMPLLLRRHPRLRKEFPLCLFYRREHIWLPPALLGVALLRRSRLASLLTLPYLAHALPRRGELPRQRVRAFVELPGRVAIDVAEMLALARGSLRHRTPFL